jgi:hypothetical protein
MTETKYVRPRLAHFSGSSRKPYSDARSVHQTTPVEAREASRPAWGRWLKIAVSVLRWNETINDAAIPFMSGSELAMDLAGSL